MAQFINKKEMLVQHSLDGLLCTSGGGSGHEPAHAGFVGTGMLTAAVCGEVFASPSIDAVFAAIMAVTGTGGCLLIINNYTGDRLNFGLALERARSLGKKVEVVIVKDDIAIPEVTKPRGIAGVIFVEKIAGHYAEKGWPLHKVARVAQKAADALVSLGLALTSLGSAGKIVHRAARQNWGWTFMVSRAWN